MEAKHQWRPYLVGVVGPTASGKTTFAKKVDAEVTAGMVKRIGYDDNLTVSRFSHDSYYRAITGRRPEDVNFDHPDQLESTLLIEHLIQLRSGQRANIPKYDFVTHSRLPETVLVNPTRVIIVDGILMYVDPTLRNMFDLRIFIDVPQGERTIRRIDRDQMERGRTYEFVKHQLRTTVWPSEEQFVFPSRTFAALIVTGGADNEDGVKAVAGRILDHITNGHNHR